MTADEAPAVLDLMVETFEDLGRRLGHEIPPRPDPAPGWIRIRHLVGTDPGGAWVTESDGQLTGAVLALEREGIWGLSLLVVRPGHQSSGLGRKLLQAGLDHGNGARGGIILASEDRRALRAYARAGFDLHPAMDARGRLTRRPERPDAVREGRWPADRETIDAVGRFVRTAAHGDDIGAAIASGHRLLVHEHGGFALFRGGETRLIAAESDAAAADLLRAVLHEAPEDADLDVNFITSGQSWATQVALEAGLELHPSGAIFTRGDVGPMRPYLPSGAYL